MPIEFPCPSCQKKLRVPDGSTGRNARCPACKSVNVVPDISTLSEPAAPPQTATGDAEAPFVAESQSPPDATDSFSDSTASDSGNPFQSPSQAANDVAISPTAPGEIGHARIYFVDVLNTAWEVFKSQWLMACVAMLIASAVCLGIHLFSQMILSLLFNLIFFRIGPNGLLLFYGAIFAMTVLQLIPQSWIFAGLVMVFLDIARGREINLGKLFQGGPALWRVYRGGLLLFFLYIVITAAFLIMPFLVATAGPNQAGIAVLAGTIGYLLGLFFMLFLLIVLAPIYPLIIDANQGVFEAISNSVRITRGNCGSITLVCLSLLLIGLGAILVGLLALLVGVIPAVIAFSAYAMCAYVVTYLQMTDQPITPKRPQA